MPTWPVAAGSLAAGFAVAQATGVRPGVGAWPSVAIVGAVVAAGSYAVADAAPARRPVSA
jgi:hypothetical protein